MMLHRHFVENKRREQQAKREKTAVREEVYESEVFPPEEESGEPKRGRRKKTEE